MLASMESGVESSELQQLVPSDEDREGEIEDGIAQEDNLHEVKVISPGNKDISGTTSRSSLSKSHPSAVHSHGASKISFINEKRGGKETQTKTAPTASTLRPRNTHKAAPTGTGSARHHCFLSAVPDVKHMERALLGLLGEFQAGGLRAFGAGRTMDQMTDIRRQQERLAKLHFDLGATTEPSLTDAGLRHGRDTMAQLIERLEQLSVSIEALHSSTVD